MENFNKIQRSPGLHDSGGNKESYISGDYGNEYHVLGMIFRMGGFSAVKDMLKKSGQYQNSPDFHMKTYEEKSEIMGYTPVTDEIKDKVKRINELAKQMNALTANPDDMDEDTFRKIYDELDLLVKGDEESNLPQKELVYDTELKMKFLSNLERIGLSDSEEIKSAMNTALEIHKDQKPRPDGPYVNHIMRVSNRIIEEYGIQDSKIIISALLHDSVEDQAKKLAEMVSNTEITSERDKALIFIKDNFGERVQKIVSKLSNPEPETEGLSPEQKNSIYKDHVKEIIEDSDVLPIKLSDFSDNALNLEAVSDPVRRLKLSKKYLPVMEIFIERLKSAQDILSEEKITEMINRLAQAIEDTKSFIQTQDIK
jgi:hypothetical protein